MGYRRNAARITSAGPTKAYPAAWRSQRGWTVAGLTVPGSADPELPHPDLVRGRLHRLHHGLRGLLARDERLHPLGQRLLDRRREDDPGGAGGLELEELRVQRILERLHLVGDRVRVDRPVGREPEV